MSRNHTFAAVALLSIAFLLGGCASQGLNPGTGDVSFRLLWQGEADLDLHVIDPEGEHIGVVVPGYQPTPEEMAALAKRFRAEQSGEELPPGGVLDVDCNAGPDRMCPRPIENVFWPVGTAPSGRYTTWVVLFQELRNDSEVPFTLEVRRGKQVVETYSGTVADAARESTRFEYAYAASP